MRAPCLPLDGPVLRGAFRTSAVVSLPLIACLIILAALRPSHSAWAYALDLRGGGEPAPVQAAHDGRADRSLLPLIDAESVASNVLDVCSSSCTFSAVQLAIDAANSGDLIRVAQGIYTGSIRVTKTVILEGGYSGPPNWQRNLSAYVTALDGNGIGPVIAVTSGYSPTIDGFTITGGKADYWGGGVLVDSSSPTLSRNTITNNQAIWGGGIWVRDGSPVLRHNTIISNYASNYGGGVYIIGGVASPTLSSNHILSNTAMNGGGVFIDDYSSPILNNNVIAWNLGASNGGGLYIDFLSTPTIANNTIVENNRGPWWANEGIFLFNSPSPTLVNNIIVSHSYGIRGTPPTSTIDYNDVWECTVTCYAGVPPGPHDVSFDPHFVDRAAGDYHLRCDSPVVDRSTHAAAPPADFDGDPRPTHSGVDMGADEFSGTLCPSDYRFDFNDLTPTQQIEKPFGYGPYWDVDPSWGAGAWFSDDITVRDGVLAITASFALASDFSRKGFIGVVLLPNADIQNKTHRVIRAEVKFDPPISSDQLLPSIFLYDRIDAGRECMDSGCKWYPSRVLPVVGVTWQEVEFDLGNPVHFATGGLTATDITTRSLKNILKVGVQLYANQAYSGVIYLDNVSTGGKEIITNFVNLNQGFVTRDGSRFALNGKPYRFAGNNVYYLFYKSHFMIDDVMETMQRNGLRVLRTWGFSDGKAPFAQDGDSTANGNEGSAFQPESRLYYTPTFVNFDYVIRSAGEHGIRLIIPLVNYWSDKDTITGTNAFGGMAQYLEWCGIPLIYTSTGYLANKDLFYTNSCIKDAYKAYIRHMISRVNTLTGVPYKDDPTILAWELANEPRCQVGDGCPPLSTTIVYSWALEMSEHIKSIDPNHLVAFGDEGFLCEPGDSDPFYNCSYVIDWERNLGIPTIDFGTVHVYPDNWDKDLTWAKNWIIRHITIAQQVGKPVVFEEFGVCHDNGTNPYLPSGQCDNRFNRDEVYREWTSLFEAQADGDAVWLIAGRVNGKNEAPVLLNGDYYYPDYDGFTFWEPISSTMSIIRRHAACMNAFCLYLPIVLKSS